MSINKKLDVAIIGAGFAGVGAGIKLRQRKDVSFKIFEKSNDVGGTWRDNTYPGCACNIPSNLYSPLNPHLSTQCLLLPSSFCYIKSVVLIVFSVDEYEI